MGALKRVFYLHRTSIPLTFPPHKADLFKSALLYIWQLGPFSALCRDPKSKSEISFAVWDRYATVSLAVLKLQKCCKALLPALISPVPYKPYRVEASFAFYR